MKAELSQLIARKIAARLVLLLEIQCGVLYNEVQNLL